MPITVACFAAPTGPVDLLLVGPNDACLRPILAKVTRLQTETEASWTVWTGELDGKTVAVTRGEGDPLNAVAATTLAVRHHPPRLIVVFDCARSYDPALHAGDIVVSRAFAAFDGFVSPVTGLGGGTHPLTWEKLPHLLMTAGEKEIPAETFPADAAAVKLALSLSPVRGRIVAGVLGSANQFNREADRIVWIHREWGVSCADGESADVAGCAALLGIPVVGASVVDGQPADAAAFALEFVEAWK